MIPNSDGKFYFSYTRVQQISFLLYIYIYKLYTYMCILGLIVLTDKIEL